MVNSSNSEQVENMNKAATHEMPHAFNNRWDSNTKHNVQSITQNGLQSSQTVLDALRLRRGSETAQWLNGLQNEISVNRETNLESSELAPLPSLAPQTQPKFATDTETMIDKAIHSLDKIFDEFELYSLAFNQTAPGTDLLVSTTPPIKNETTDQSLIAYAGHLSTKLWSMVIRGCASKIEVFVIPSELLLAFSIHSMEEAGYQPLLVVEAEWRDGKPIWHIENTVITAEHIPLLAKELFGDLIRIASGQMTESELFVHPTQQFDLGKNLAVGEKSSQSPETSLPEDPAATHINKPDSNRPDTAAVPTNKSNDTPPVGNQANVSLKSINVAEQLLVLINEDINHLLEIGKVYLQSESTSDFQKIKTLTEQLAALKETVSTSLTHLRQDTK